jgi:hypothetical protein
MTVPSPLTDRPNGRNPIDPTWWRDGMVDGQPIREAIASRDVGAILRFLRGLGWSVPALAAATGLSEPRVRAIMRGTQRITSYEVLERVAVGLCIPRGAMGLAYTD